MGPSLQQKSFGLRSSLLGPVQLPLALLLLEGGDEAGVQDVLLGLPGAVLDGPALPFHQVLDAALFFHWSFSRTQGPFSILFPTTLHVYTDRSN